MSNLNLQPLLFWLAQIAAIHLEICFFDLLSNFAEFENFVQKLEPLAAFSYSIQILLFRTSFTQSFSQCFENWHSGLEFADQWVKLHYSPQRGNFAQKATGSWNSSTQHCPDWQHPNYSCDPLYILPISLHCSSHLLPIEESWSFVGDFLCLAQLGCKYLEVQNWRA